jgi:hypothetical protein
MLPAPDGHVHQRLLHEQEDARHGCIDQGIEFLL